MINGTEQLEHQLALQARQIEAVFRSIERPVLVAGGSVDGRWTIFELMPDIQHGDTCTADLERQLARTLRVPSVRLRLNVTKPTVAVLQPPPAPVDLPGLLRALPELPPATAVLGLDEARRPVILDLTSSSVSNVLLSGVAGCGIDHLVRSLFVSLALGNRQSQVQLAAIDYRQAQAEKQGRDDKLYPLGLLPHMLGPVLTELEEIAGFLGHLVGEASYRHEQQVCWPLIVIALGDLHEILGDGGRPVREPLAQLLQIGPEAGIHLLLGTHEPLAAGIQQLVRGNVTVRLSGRQLDSRAARAATGMPDSGADYLPGPGRFLAASAGSLVHFQAAAVSDYDLHLTVERLQRQGRRSLVAQPATPPWQLRDHDSPHPSGRFVLGANQYDGLSGS